MHIEPRALLLAAVVAAGFEALRRLNGRHVRDVAAVPYKPIAIARGPRGLEP